MGSIRSQQALQKKGMGSLFNIRLQLMHSTGMTNRTA
jgi:hypothetical protein